MDGFYRTSDGAQEIVKDPDAILDYKFLWSEWLDGDTISTATIEVAGSATLVLASNADNAAIPASGFSVADGTVTVWLKGGAVRDRASVACTITTGSGRKDERTFYVRVQEK